MYTRIRNPRITIYDGVTKELIGIANFKLTPDSEKDLLELVNYGKVPDSLLILDIGLFRPAKGYLPPLPFEAYGREGILNALTGLLNGNKISFLRCKAINRPRITEVVFRQGNDTEW